MSVRQPFEETPGGRRVMRWDRMSSTELFVLRKLLRPSSDPLAERMVDEIGRVLRARERARHEDALRRGD